MNRRTAIAAFSLAVGIALFVGCSDGIFLPDKVTRVEEDDAEMAAAIAQARATLPHFWQVFARRDQGEDDFCLKVKISDANGTEYFWLRGLAQKDGRLYGSVDNTPQIVGNVRLGDRLPIAVEDVVDWLYMRDGKMAGNYTVRALLGKMSPDEAEAIKKMLAAPESGRRADGR